MLAVAIAVAISTLFAAPRKQNISVLYVGGTAEFDDSMGLNGHSQEEYDASVKSRMASWEKFLKEYFKVVEVVHGDNYTQDMSDRYDVTVFDGRPKQLTPRYHSRVTRDYNGATYLTHDFDRPALMVGHMSDNLTRSLGTKNDWYCLCLMSHAHTWRAEHPIFKGPYKVKITTEERPTPEGIKSFPHHFEDNKVPETMTMWRVQKYDFTGDSDVRIGMVSRPGGYEDSPEAEWISGGECAKSPDAMALGRHGNFFHWGFAASPDYLTDEAKPLLANAIVYISQFAGQTPIARKYDDRVITRDYIGDKKYFMTREFYESYVEQNREYNRMTEEKKREVQARIDAGEQVSEQDRFYLTARLMDIVSYDEFLQQQEGELYALYGADVEKYAQHYDENLPYYYGGGPRGLTIDEDAKRLGIANNDIALIDKAIQLWEKREDVACAKRLLERYTLMDFSTAAEWRRWLEENRERLFFSESAGWKWIVNSREEGANPYFEYFMREKAARARAAATDDMNPVAVGTAASILYDGSWVLTVRLALHKGYHIYDKVAPNDVFVPTTVKFDLPEGAELVGDPIVPQGEFYTANGTTVFRSDAIYQQRIKGKVGDKVKVQLEYQCCDPTICFPPTMQELTIELQ